MSIKTKRIGSNFVKEISYILMEEIKDPNIKFVTITSCDVTNDLSYAKVYFTVLNEEKKDEVLESLNKASNFIVSCLFVSIALCPFCASARCIIKSL